MSLADDVAALQTRITDAQRQRARAEGARDTAQAALTKVQDELKADFGVTTAEQAEQLLARLRDDLTGLVTQINSRLDEIGV